MKLSIVMPVYNEAATVQSAIKGVLDVEYPCPVELVIVDDASTDGTAEILQALRDERVVKLRHPSNRGKGAAVRTAVAAATGNYIELFDADLEYRPPDQAIRGADHLPGSQPRGRQEDHLAGWGQGGRDLGPRPAHAPAVMCWPRRRRPDGERRPGRAVRDPAGGGVVLLVRLCWRPRLWLRSPGSRS